MQLSEFDFSFPQELIAMHPAPKGQSRMMVVEKDTGQVIKHCRTQDLIQFLNPGDALVLNDTKVIPARLYGKSRQSQAPVEVLLTGLPNSEGVCHAMVKPGKRFKTGNVLDFGVGLYAEVLGKTKDGLRILRFYTELGSLIEALEKVGHMPLPPYIKRPDEPGDKTAYQSVFAENPGAVAAPTASLHFSREYLQKIQDSGVHIVKVTLHVGLGTFKPVQTEEISQHTMHSETYFISAMSAQKLNQIRAGGGRIWALGTTSARVLETVYKPDEKKFVQAEGSTDLFITPGYRWKGLDGLLTNFHWPKSTLFMLVSSLLGTQKAKQAYAEAIEMGYRLFSFGDAMLIIPKKG